MNHTEATQLAKEVTAAMIGDQLLNLILAVHEICPTDTPAAARTAIRLLRDHASQLEKARTKSLHELLDEAMSKHGVELKAKVSGTDTDSKTERLNAFADAINARKGTPKGERALKALIGLGMIGAVTGDEDGKVEAAMQKIVDDLDSTDDEDDGDWSTMAVILSDKPIKPETKKGE